jgi:(p)ppGpp synthase/HD superfamily hydrolase
MKKIFEAMELATKALGSVYPPENRYRKYNKDIPASVHSVRVCSKVHTYVTEWPSATKFIPLHETMLIIAILHDVPEDTSVTLDYIQHNFGDEVRNGVYWLTNISKGSKERRSVRKEMDRMHLEAAPDHIKVIKMWDRIDNLHDMIEAPKDFVLNRYCPESRELEKVLRPADPILADHLIQSCDWLESIVKGKHE